MIEVKIPGIPPRPNATRRRHWHANADEARDWRMLAAGAGRRAMIGRADKIPIFRATVEYVFVLTRATGDLDGLIAASKPLVDGLRDAGILRDDSVSALPEIRASWVRGTVAGVILRVREATE